MNKLTIFGAVLLAVFITALIYCVMPKSCVRIDIRMGQKVKVYSTLQNGTSSMSETMDVDGVNYLKYKTDESYVYVYLNDHRLIVPRENVLQIVE